jgi:hypothetical protein
MTEAPQMMKAFREALSRLKQGRLHGAAVLVAG